MSSKSNLTDKMENWRIILSKKYKESIFEDLFLDYSNIKRLAKKYKKSKNTVKPYLRKLSELGYLKDYERKTYNNGQTINYAKKATFNPFFDYCNIVKKNLLNSQDKKIISFIFQERELRLMALNSSGKNVFEKLAYFLLEFCVRELNWPSTDGFRYKYKGFIEHIRKYYSTEYLPIKKINKENLFPSLKKVQKNLPYGFIIKIFRITLPFLLAQKIFEEQINNLEETKKLIKEKSFDLVSKPSIKDIDLALKEWNEYKEGVIKWGLDPITNQLIGINLKNVDNKKRLFFSDNKKIFELKDGKLVETNSNSTIYS